MNDNIDTLGMKGKLLASLLLFSTDLLAQVPIYRTTATDLYALYDANEIAANQKIAGSQVKVSGTIDEIRESLGHALIRLGVPNTLTGVSLTLYDSQKERAGTLAKHQHIKILCGKMSKGIFGPLGEDCVIE